MIPSVFVGRMKPILSSTHCHKSLRRIQALTDEAFNERPEKKRRKKDKPAAPESVTPTRPGKKRLRKMRYLQGSLSAEDFMVHVADNTLSTGSVSIQRASGSRHPVASYVEIHTSSMNQNQNHAAWNEAQMHGKPRITAGTDVRIQPLLVLDLNGILCYRIRAERVNIERAVFRPPVGVFAGTPVVPRSNLAELLSFLDQHFCLAVWTSAKEMTAKSLCQALIPPDIHSRLLFVWAQGQCDCVKDGKERLFRKDLAKVWTYFPLWNEKNTLIIDDSPAKCVSQRENAFHPHPLNGLDFSLTPLDVTHHLLDDNDNEKQQQEFFEALSHHWKLHPLIQKVHVNTKTFQLPSVSQAQFLQERKSTVKTQNE